MKAASNLFLGKGRHVSCFAHTIHLVVDNVVKEISSFSNVLDKVKKIVTHFKHSPAAMDMLRKLQKDEGVSEGRIRTLVQSVDTRWNSCLDMLISFLSLSNKVAIVLINRASSVKGLPDMLTSNEIYLCQDFCDFLKPFKEATEKISGDNYVTVSMIIPLIALLVEKIRNLNVASNEGILTKELLLKVSEDRFKSLQCNKILAKSSMLDPRFKKLYLPPLIASEVVRDIVSEISQKISEDSLTESANPFNDEHTLCESEGFQEAHQRSIALRQTTREVPQNQELSLFLSLPFASWESDPITFWTSQKETFPVLAELAIGYLITPGSSVASERLASAIKCVVADTRSRMTDTHVTQRVFLKSLKKEFWT
ncbi:uncharacterized protein Dana_GF26419 [Drosophila ananassae]|uniref:HAT C-terminal dimerisation domain-containing protein n=2 Tax=Drosophila ananassae TaxID=7217 RepID=A0A0P8Y124_DROAN|nr:uncharacterized protein Dana_GF26419 [Drosophila ananassae]